MKASRLNILKKMEEIRFRKRRLQLTPFERRHDDIYIVSYPKSGNTWLLFLIANTILKYLGIEYNVNLFNIHAVIPDVHNSRDIPNELQFTPFRRIIKNHSNYNPYYNQMYLLIRNPSDVMVSYYYFKKSLNQIDMSLSKFIRNKSYGIENWVRHIESWFEMSTPSQQIRLIHYENLKKEPFEELSKLFNTMGFEIDPEIINFAIDRSSFEYMKTIEEKHKSFSTAKYENYRFLRKGVVGDGRDSFSEEDMEFIRSKVSNILKLIGYENTMEL